MLDVPAGTITLLFTDIEGSTLLLQHVGEQYSHMLAQCRQLLRTAFQRVGIFSHSVTGWLYQQYRAGQSFHLASLDLEIEVRQGVSPSLYSSGG